ncbi:hypothetical protein GPALN_015058 [Globodera pallida]|nr:hypothetical protein GPALN_015058 [Globodera pallida]
MVAILLRRPVAIVHPNATREQLQAHAAQWNDNNQYPQIIDVYFPEGIARRVQNNMALEELQQFNLICDNGEGQQFQRQVTNPIVLWYNGLNHFETLVLVFKLIQLPEKHLSSDSDDDDGGGGAAHSCSGAGPGRSGGAPPSAGAAGACVPAQ